MATRPTELGYRRDIEGLRAVAVVLVVLAHAQVPGFGAGFIGVDMFFVLSGYLITGLLVLERENTGATRFASFFARRFRRLMPALLLMLVVVALVSRAVLPEADQARLATSGAFAAVWASNLHFAFAGVDYFGGDAKGDLFLHTWSLGVEEQFYLVWPALIALAAWACVGWRRNLRSGVLALMLLVLGLSFGLCLALVARSEQMAFYLMPARAWQFAAGGMVFLLFGPGGYLEDVQLDRRLLAMAMGVAGVAMLAWALVAIDDGHAYPGAWALLPTLSTCLLVASGAAWSGGAVARLLSLRPFEALGKLSYSIYLWHWPILVMGGVATGQADGPARAFLVLASLGLATLSYLLVERPIRGARTLSGRPGWVVSLALASIATATVAALVWQFEARSRGALMDASPLARAVVYEKGCDDWYHSDHLVPCRFGEGRRAGRVVIIGDSVGMHWFPAVESIAAAADVELVALTKSGCAIVDAPFHYERIGREYTECARWRARALAFIAQEAPDLLIIGSSDSYPFTEREWTEGMRSVLAEATATADRVVILRSTPRLPFDGPRCAARLRHAGVPLIGVDSCASPASTPRSDEVHAWQQAIAGAFPSVAVVDMNDVVCPGNVCEATRDGTLVYSDDQHLNAHFVRGLADTLAERIGWGFAP